MSPFLKWTLAVIAGGGAAGLVQSATVMTRAASSATTGGLANPLVSTLELAGATITSILALIAPLLAMVMVTALIVFVARKVFKLRSAASNAQVQPGISLSPTK